MRFLRILGLRLRCSGSYLTKKASLVLLLLRIVVLHLRDTVILTEKGCF